ncbi:uncharacterized protein LOC141637302 [Silene latifolia]|uniref:uncharacterized protein LOC141637302 n=1 Tax=Silene latifolia TaxID=37657 RepID=UPI003D7857E9
MKFFQPAYTDDCWLGKATEYTVREGYDWLRSSSPSVSWWRLCWNSMNIPKSSFIYWVFMLKRLLTKDRLVRMGGGTDVTCDLCQTANESHEHLFFDCYFSNRCSILLQQKLGFQINPSALIDWNRRGRRKSILMRRVTTACYVQLVYMIWQERNRARIHSQVTHPVAVVRQVIKAVHTRFQMRNKSKLTKEEEAWIMQMTR